MKQLAWATAGTSIYFILLVGLSIYNQGEMSIGKGAMILLTCILPIILIVYYCEEDEF